jgi:NAD+ synthase
MTPPMEIPIGDPITSVQTVIYGGCKRSEYDYEVNFQENCVGGNIAARLRMVILYAISNSMGGLVMNTCNKTEDILGYATLYGDSVGAFSPLGQIGKMTVYKLAEYSNIPSEIIDRIPSAELSEGQTDEDELGAPYSVLDPLANALDNGQISKAVEICEGDSKYVCKMMERVHANAFKMNFAPESIDLQDWEYWQRFPV